MGNSSKNERYAINAVAELIDSSPRLSAEFNSNDRTPCYDGDILIYDKDDTNSNEHLTGRLPVQIKFRQCDTKEGPIKFSIKRNDLEFYYREGGVLYFIVTKDVRPRVYYASLLPYDIRIALSAASEDQKSISFNFSVFPSDKDEILTLLVNVLSDKRNQAQLPTIDEKSFRELCAQVTKTRRVQIDVTIPNGIPVYNALGIKRYCYAGVEVPSLKVAIGVAENGLESITQTYTAGVTCGGETFYDSTCVKIFKGQTIVAVGNNVTLVLYRDQHASLNIKSRGRLSERLEDAKFFAAIKIHRTFSFAPQCHLASFTIAKDSMLENHSIEDVRALATLLDLADLKFDFDIDSFTQKDWDAVNYLNRKLLRGKELRFVRNEVFFELLTLGGETFLMLRGVSKGNTVICSPKWFDSVIDVKSGEEEFEASFFLALTADMLRAVTQIDFEYILSEIVKAKRTKRYIDQLHKWLVNTILPVVDEGRFPDGSLLSFAEKLFKWVCLDPCGFEDFAFLNLCQIHYRQKKLSEQEIVRLREISVNERKLAMIRAGAYILLDDRAGYQLQYERLNGEEKKTFDQFPILHLIHARGARDSCGTVDMIRSE